MITEIVKLGEHLNKVSVDAQDESQGPQDKKSGTLARSNKALRFPGKAAKRNVRVRVDVSTY